MRRLLFIAILIFVSLIGCKPELLGEYYLGNLTQANPYAGYEELVYITSSNDTVILYGKGRTRSTSRVYPSVNSNDYFIVEEDYSLFSDQIGKIELRLKLATSSNWTSELSIRLSEHFSEDTGHFTYLSYFNLPLTETNLFPDQDFFDSLFVFNRYYYNVFSDSTSFSEHPNKSNGMKVNPSVFYYNTTQGLIKIDCYDGSTWYLNDIY